jgi:hypothetical protein
MSEPIRGPALDRRRTRVVRLGAAGAAVLLAAATLLVSAVALSPGSPASPSPASPSAALSHDATRYDDGIPRTWQGQPVWRGQAALAHAAQSTDSSPFYVGLWYSSQLPGFGCPPVEPEPLGCSALLFVGDRAGVRWPALGNALRFGLDVPDGPLVLRVHTHDPEWSGPSRCPASEMATCAHLMIGEAAVWTGDAGTAPHPVTVPEAAAAFGLAKPETVFEGCLTPELPGVRILPFRDPESSTGYTYGVIAVFPSAEAVAGAAPDAAATGETETPLGYSTVCVIDGTMHWLARANVLVGVIEYDPSVGPAGDQWVVLARSELRKLPAG